MPVYYNEIEPYAAQWLRNLIAAGHLPAGDVDERSIEAVQPADLTGYDACHFFAGIGGWAYALQLAGWAPGRPVWTGSCPCQPFSVAGRGQGADDARHLWPAWARLIRECRPPVVFGEQTQSRIGRTWLAAVRADLEGLGYAVGAADLCAAGAGAPHLRQRLWFVADAGHGDEHQRRKVGRTSCGGEGEAPQQRLRHDARDGEPTRGLADATDPNGWPRERGIRRATRSTGTAGETGSPWADLLWLPCRDGKARPTQPGLFPLVTGLPTAVDGLGPISRVGTLRGAGNAITPEVGAAFVSAYLECRP